MCRIKQESRNPVRYKYNWSSKRLIQRIFFYQNSFYQNLFIRKYSSEFIVIFNRISLKRPFNTSTKDFDFFVSPGLFGRSNKTKTRKRKTFASNCLHPHRHMVVTYLMGVGFCNSLICVAFGFTAFGFTGFGQTVAFIQL